LIEDSFDLVAPGVVRADQWNPDPEDDGELPQPIVLAAVGRRR